MLPPDKRKRSLLSWGLTPPIALGDAVPRSAPNPSTGIPSRGFNGSEKLSVLCSGTYLRGAFFDPLLASPCGTFRFKVDLVRKGADWRIVWAQRYRWMLAE